MRPSDAASEGALLRYSYIRDVRAVRVVSEQTTYNQNVTDTDEETKLKRVAKVSAWIDVLEETARELELELLTREHELEGSSTGADPDPRAIPCRHPGVNRRGRLCLSCMNTGFVLDQGGGYAKVDGEPVDPYYVNLRKDGVTVKLDQSESAERAREIARIDNALDTLERNARIRDGLEVHEGELAAVRVTERLEASLGWSGRKVARTLNYLRTQGSTGEYVYRCAIDRQLVALMIVATLTKGRLDHPYGNRGGMLAVLPARV